MSNIKVIGKIGGFQTIEATQTEDSKYLKAYVEDCGQSAALTYNYDKLCRLEFIGLDLSAACIDGSSSDYGIQHTLNMLQKNKYDGKLFIHFDQTEGSNMCTPQPKPSELPNTDSTKIFTQCFKSLLSKNFTTDILDGVLWEQESNKFINTCASDNCKIGINKIPDIKKYFKSKDIKFAGWVTNFNFIDKRSDIKYWDYILYEYYNIYTSCSVVDDNTKCYIDYSGLKIFPGAILFAKLDENYKIKPGTEIKCKDDCVGAKNTVYCCNINASSYERGQWMAYIYAFKMDFNLPYIVDITKKIIFFPFTTASSPTFLDILDTPNKFDNFIEGFISVFKNYGCKNISECKFGAWGCPRWIGSSDDDIVDPHMCK